MNRVLMLFAVVLFATACKPSDSTTRNPSPVEAPSFEAFMTFYNRYHQDSAFQMDHILFPLEGLPSYADSSAFQGREFRWTPDNWKLQRGFDPTSGFEREFTPVTDRIIVERMVHESGDFAMERRWAYLKDDWYLIYYAGINRVRQ